MCFLNVEAHKSPSIFCLCIHVSQELFSFGFSSFQCISSAVSKAMLPKKRKLWTPSQLSQPKGHDWAPTKQVEWVRGNVAPTVWPTRCLAQCAFCRMWVVKLVFSVLDITLHDPHKVWLLRRLFILIFRDEYAGSGPDSQILRGAKIVEW